MEEANHSVVVYEKLFRSLLTRMALPSYTKDVICESFPLLAEKKSSFSPSGVFLSVECVENGESGESGESGENTHLLFGRSTGAQNWKNIWSAGVLMKNGWSAGALLL